MSKEVEWVLLTVLDEELTQTKVVFRTRDIERVVESALGSTIFVSDGAFMTDSIKRIEVEETPDQVIRKLGPVSLW